MKRMTCAILALGLTMAAGPATAAELIKLRVAYDGFSMTSAPLMYGKEHGIFKSFGLDVNPAFVEGGSLLTQAVVGGSVDIAQNGYTPAAGAAVNGADIVFIGGISNTLPFQLVVQASVQKPADLKGKSIAISRFGSSTDTAAEFALAHLGLKKDDVLVRQLGGPANRVAAVLSGQVAGTMEQQPETADLVRKGLHVLVDVTDIATDYPNTSYVTSRTFLKGNRETVNGDGERRARLQDPSRRGGRRGAEVPERQGRGRRARRLRHLCESLSRRSAPFDQGHRPRYRQSREGQSEDRRRQGGAVRRHRTAR
jgi:NitT/TauT family transport system substrate-binding protein